MIKNKMVTEVKRILKKDVIILDDLIMRPLQDENDDDIKGLSISFNNNGMLNEINVRESKIQKGKYELMAGARRFVATKEDYILAKVFKNVPDLRAMIIGLTENKQRKDPDPNVSDAFTYRAWKKGKNDGDFKTIQDMVDETGDDINMLGMIIAAGELKDIDPDPIVQKANTYDISNTKVIAEHPDLRHDLLKKRQDNKVIFEDLGKIAEDIKRELSTGTEKEVIKKVLDIVDNVNKPSETVSAITTNKDNKIGSKIKTSVSVPIKTSVSEPIKISDSKFTDTLDTFKKSPPDIQEKLEKREIDVGEAKLLNQFDTPERRNKVLNDLKVTEEVNELDKKKTVDTRLKQQQDLNNKGETSLKTRQDRALEEELKKERDKDKIHDQRCLDRYQRMSSYILETVSGFSPKALRTDEVKKKAVKIFRGNYELFHSILVALGDIREIVPENIKRERAIGIGNTVVDADIIDAVIVESKEE